MTETQGVHLRVLGVSFPMNINMRGLDGFRWQAPRAMLFLIRRSGHFPTRLSKVTTRLPHVLVMDTRRKES